jgi:hypothetical protein
VENEAPARRIQKRERRADPPSGSTAETRRAAGGAGRGTERSRLRHVLEDVTLEDVLTGRLPAHVTRMAERYGVDERP